MTSGGDVGNLIRRFVVPRIILLPGMREQDRRRHHPGLLRTARDGSPIAPRRRRLDGTLCPNPLLANGARFDADLGYWFRSGHRRDPELAGWLHGGRATAAIVRPDGPVMRAGNDPGALRTAMPRLRHPRKEIDR